MARLTSTSAGIVGENAVTSALVRAGLLVAQPFWGDNEIDRIVLFDNGTRLIMIPVQIKAVQAVVNKKEAKIQKLWKRYVEENKYLCLAIYSIERDKIWLFTTASNIKKAYGEWATAPVKTKPRKQYDDINTQKGQVSIRVNVTEAGDPEFDGKWLLNVHDFDSVTQRFNNVANEMQNDKAYFEACGYQYIGQGGIGVSGGSEYDQE